MPERCKKGVFLIYEYDIDANYINLCYIHFSLCRDTKHCNHRNIRAYLRIFWISPL